MVRIGSTVCWKNTNIVSLANSVPEGSVHRRKIGFVGLDDSKYFLGNNDASTIVELIKICSCLTKEIVTRVVRTSAGRRHRFQNTVSESAPFHANRILQKSSQDGDENAVKICFMCGFAWIWVDAIAQLSTEGMCIRCGTYICPSRRS